jgi:hydrogenase maturation protease
VTLQAVVIGIGNPYRRDDGIGPEVAAQIEARRLPGVRVVISDGEPSGLLEAWEGADLAVVVDAIQRVPASPGSIHRLTTSQLETGCAAASSHGLGVADAIRLGRALERLPRQVVILAVEGADTGLGTGFSGAVAAAVPRAVAAVMAELKRTRSPDKPGGRNPAPHGQGQHRRGELPVDQSVDGVSSTSETGRRGDRGTGRP